GQTMGINGQMDLRRLAATTFSNGFRVLRRRTRAVLMGSDIAAIEKSPFHIRLHHQRTENRTPLTTTRPSIKPFVDPAPTTEGLGEIPPRTTHPHPIQHAFDGHPQISLVIDAVLTQNLP